MAFWLFKEEPSHYSFADLLRDGKTQWAGVKNALARQNLRKVSKGDRIFFYHTGKEKAIVGEMKAAGPAGPDSNDSDPKAVVVEVVPVRPLARPVQLTEIKKEPMLKDWELVRMSRLSVMPVSVDQWKLIAELSKR